MTFSQYCARKKEPIFTFYQTRVAFLFKTSDQLNLAGLVFISASGNYFGVPFHLPSVYMNGCDLSSSYVVEEEEMDMVVADDVLPRKGQVSRLLHNRRT